MKALVQLDWRTVTRSRRNLLVLLLVALAALGFVPAARSQGLGDFARSGVQLRDRTKLAYLQIARYTLPEQARLRETGALISDAWSGAVVLALGGELNDEYDARDGMARLGVALQRGGLTGYPGLYGVAMPSRATGRRLQLVAQWLTARDRPVQRRVQDVASAWAQLVPLLAAGLPFLVMVLAADIWLTTTARGSITAGLPLGLPQQAGAKLLTRIGLPLVTVAATLALVAAVAGALGGLGDLSYPLPMTLWGQLCRVPVGLAPLVLLGETLVVSAFGCSLMLLLNVWLPNAYWSLLAGAGLALVPLLLPQVATRAWWLPLAALAPQRVMQGAFQNETGQVALSLGGTGLTMLAWTALLIAAFAWSTARRVR